MVDFEGQEDGKLMAAVGVDAACSLPFRLPFSMAMRGILIFENEDETETEEGEIDDFFS